MQLVQRHPTALPDTGILITEGCRGEGAILTNKNGDRYLQDYGLGPPDPWPRPKAEELGPCDRLFAGLPDFLNKLESVKPRDQGWGARADVANVEQGVWGCTLVGYRTEVCPRGVDPAPAINQNKVNSTLDYVGLALLLQPKGARK